ncbi:MAG: NERD domain-containing protein [Tetragenococcus sp.]|nr:NERD domain-containing protein [Tetragenococcus sp.]
MRKKSHDLQWLGIFGQRHLLTEEERETYQKLQRAYYGEAMMDKLVANFLANDPQCIDDITLKYKNSVVQIDKLLIVGQIAYIIDMKYYRGHYVFKNNTWYIGEKILDNNIFEQLRRAMRILQNLFNDNQIRLNVQGVLAFMNPNSTIDVVDNIDETVLTMDEIPKWLLKLPNNGTVESMNQNWKSTLRQYEIEPYRTKRTFDIEKIDQLQQGICCPNCHQYQMVESKYIVNCTCGYSEAKEIAYTRTICEYGVLFHNHNLTVPQLRKFFGKNLNERYLTYVLQRNFVLQKKAHNKAGYYI